jgi:hypothetical protein
MSLMVLIIRGLLKEYIRVHTEWRFNRGERKFKFLGQKAGSRRGTEDGLKRQAAVGVTDTVFNPDH